VAQDRAGDSGEHRFGVPDRPGRQVLQPVRAPVADRLGDRPAVRRRQSHQQATDEIPERGAGLAAIEHTRHVTLQVFQQRELIAVGYGRSGGRRVKVFRHSPS
jgi:hypothetical protein